MCSAVQCVVGSAQSTQSSFLKHVKLVLHVKVAVSLT